jgi:hypothetical protein
MGVDLRVDEVIFQLWALLVEIIFKIRKNIMELICYQMHGLTTSFNNV